MRVKAAEALCQAGDPPLRKNNWVRIPGGSFVIGERYYAREVELDAFEIGRRPVTAEEYGRYVEDGGHVPEDWDEQVQYPNRPVVRVSWHDADAYSRWAGVRLPTGAQWKLAARGREERPYPWRAEELDTERANYGETGINDATPVGCFRKERRRRIYDFRGKCGSGRVERRLRERQTAKPHRSGERSKRVLRGAGWYSAAAELRVTFRASDVPASGRRFFGFVVPGIYISLDLCRTQGVRLSDGARVFELNLR